MSNNLDLDQVAGNQNQKEVTGNDQAGQLDAAMTVATTFDIDSTDTRTLTSEEFRRSHLYIIDELGGDPADADITLTVPAVSRGQFVIRNDTAFNVTVTISGQSKAAPVIATGGETTLECDGVDVTQPQPTTFQSPFAVEADGAQSLVELFSFGNSCALRGNTSKGTKASPTASTADQALLSQSVAGHDGTTFTGVVGAIIIRAAELFTGSAQGTYITLETTEIGGTTRLEKVRVFDNGDVAIGQTTAAAKLDVNGQIKTEAVTVANLPAAGTAGRRSFVTDATATTFASIVAGTGSNNVPVYDDGTNWRIG